MESSARLANAIIACNDAQYRLARDAQRRHIVCLQAAIAIIEKRLAQPTDDTLTVDRTQSAQEGEGAQRLSDADRAVSRSYAACSRCGPNWAGCQPTG